jgi:hypothetical protein
LRFRRSFEMVQARIDRHKVGGINTRRRELGVVA